MAVFNLSTPESQYAIDPKFATGIDKFKLAMLGYNGAGMQTGLGKIESWIPGIGIQNNLLAKNLAQKNGFADTAANIAQDTDNRVDKLGLEAGIAGGIFGGVTGNPELIKSGLNMTSQFGGSLAFDQNNYVTEGNYIYR